MVEATLNMKEAVSKSEAVSRALFELRARHYDQNHGNRNGYRPLKETASALKPQAVSQAFIEEAKLVALVTAPIVVARLQTLTKDQTRLAGFIVQGFTDSEISFALRIKEYGVVLLRKIELMRTLYPEAKTAEDAKPASFAARLRKASELGLLPSPKP